MAAGARKTWSAKALQHALHVGRDGGAVVAMPAARRTPRRPSARAIARRGERLEQQRRRFAQCRSPVWWPEAVVDLEGSRSRRAPSVFPAGSASSCAGKGPPALQRLVKAGELVAELQRVRPRLRRRRALSSRVRHSSSSSSEAYGTPFHHVATALRNSARGGFLLGGGDDDQRRPCVEQGTRGAGAAAEQLGAQRALHASLGRRNSSGAQNTRRPCARTPDVASSSWPSLTTQAMVVASTRAASRPQWTG